MGDVTAWFAAVPTLVGFGLALGLNPALYGAAADTLARNQQIVIRLCWLLGGLMLGATVLLFVLMLFNPTSLVNIVEQRVNEAVLNRVVDLVAGTVLAVFAIAMAIWARRVPTPPRRTPSKRQSTGAPLTLFTIGLGSSIVGFTTLPIMYLTGRVVTGVSSAVPVQAAAYLVFLGALVAPFVALAWMWSRFPARTQKITELYGQVLQWDYRWVACAISGVGALALFVLALVSHGLP